MRPQKMGAVQRDYIVKAAESPINNQRITNESLKIYRYISGVEVRKKSHMRKGDAIFLYKA